jgi:methylisocitrate lyase
MYKRFAAAVKVPVLANITEFGATPLYTLDELREADVAIALYPSVRIPRDEQGGAFRLRRAARDGTQQAVVDSMQTRAELYDCLGYHAYEQKLDGLFAKTR